MIVISELSLFQKEVLSAISFEQEEAVQEALCNCKDPGDIEKLLYSVTSELIIRIMIKMDLPPCFLQDIRVEEPQEGSKQSLKDYSKYLVILVVNV